MRKITKLIAPALIATSVLACGVGGVATLAAAKPLLGGANQAAAFTPNRDADILAAIAGLHGRIAHAEATRAISRPEARGLRAQAAHVQRLYRQYGHGGLSSGEMSDLNTRIARIYRALHEERGHR